MQTNFDLQGRLQALHKKCYMSRRRKWYFFFLLQSHLPTSTCIASQIVPAGYYPTPNSENPIALIPCRDTDKDTTSCNPDNLPKFQCRLGYIGRLCSACENSFFYRSGLDCVQYVIEEERKVLFIVLQVSKKYRMGHCSTSCNCCLFCVSFGSFKSLVNLT